MRRRMTTRVLASFIGILALVGVVWTEPAWAHVTYIQGRPYASGYDCTDGYVELSHGSANWGFRKVRVSALYTSSGQYASNCDTPFVRPPGYLTVQEDIIKWNGYWAMCVDGDWHYNGSSTYSYTWTQNQYVSNMCGAGNYVGNGIVYMANGGGVWKGGGLNIQQFHYLPA